MLTKLVPLPQFVGVSAGGSPQIDRIPQGDTYLGILLELGGTFTKAQIDNILLKLGGKTLIDMTGSDMDKINAFYKRTASAAYLPLWFADPNARTVQGSVLGAIDTSVGYSDFTLKVKINSGAVSPTLKAYAMITDPLPSGTDEEKRNKIMLRAYLSATQSPAASGDQDLAVPIGSVAGAFMRTLHIFHAQLTKLSVKKDGVFLHEDITIAPAQYLQNELNRTTQAGLFSYDPLAYFNNQSDTIPTVRKLGERIAISNLLFRGSFAAADTVRMHNELYTTVAAI